MAAFVGLQRVAGDRCSERDGAPGDSPLFTAALLAHDAHESGDSTHDAHESGDSNGGTTVRICPDRTGELQLGVGLTVLVRRLQAQERPERVLGRRYLRRGRRPEGPLLSGVFARMTSDRRGRFPAGSSDRPSAELRSGTSIVSSAAGGGQPAPSGAASAAGVSGAETMASANDSGGACAMYSGTDSAAVCSATGVGATTGC